MTGFLSYLPFLALVATVGVTGVKFMPGDWYKSLDKPRWTPPDWAFGPAWTLLYLMIAGAGWLVWQKDGFGVPLAFWAANLAFNMAWSWIMFGQHRIRLALLDACAMLVTIIGFIWTAAGVSELAAWLFVPYLAWTTFAAALNAEIARRNPEGYSSRPAKAG